MHIYIIIYIYIYICNLVSISLNALLIRPEAWELQGRVCSRQRHHPRWRRCLRPSWAGRIWKDPCLNIDLGVLGCPGISWIIASYASFGVLLRNSVQDRSVSHCSLPWATRICFRIMFFRVCARPKEKVPVPIEQLGEHPSCTAAVLKWGVKSNVPTPGIHRWLFIHGFQQAECSILTLFHVTYKPGSSNLRGWKSVEL